jgi:hypothetical protein
MAPERGTRIGGVAEVWGSPVRLVRWPKGDCHEEGCLVGDGDDLSV